MKPPASVWWRRIGAALLALAVLALVYLLVKDFFGKTGPRKPKVQQVQIFRPPPPPPPPKPPEEKPPEPVKREEVKINEAKPEEVKPEPKPDEPPPEMKPLGLDAEGGAGADGFGLAANKGGRDITTLGPGSGTGTGTGGGSKFGWYAGLIQTHLQESIARNKRLREEEFRVIVNVWLRPDGSVQRTELVGSTGRAETDELIRLAFGDVSPVREPPPSDLPQPVRLRITNRL